MIGNATKLIKICGALVLLAASAGSSHAFLDTGSRPALTTIAGTTQASAVPLPAPAQAPPNVQSAELAPAASTSGTTTVTETNVDSAASRIKESIKNDDRKTVEKKIRAELRAFGIRF